LKSSPDSVTKEAELQLEQIQAKVTKANTHLTHLENEVRAVQKHRQSLNDDIKRETDRLLEARREILAAEGQRAKQRSDAVQYELQALDAELTELRRSKLQLEGEIAGLVATQEAQTGRITALQQQEREITASLEAKERKQQEFEVRTEFLRNGISPLEATQTQLRDSITALERTRDELIAREATLESRYVSRKEQVEQDISNLLIKQQELEVAQANMHRQHAQLSESIAARTSALDEREQVLIRREAKVAQDSRIVARNAGLLKL
jgi:chromosome segregation ATPase